MSVTKSSLLSVLNKLIRKEESMDQLNTIKPHYKVHEAMLTVLNCTINVESLYVIDEVKALILQGNTTISSVAMIELIKAKWNGCKDTSVDKHLERLILIDLINQLKLVTTVGRNQLIIGLTLSTMKLTNEKLYNVISYWK